ncbi:MAG: hypothetical protein A3E88_00470 [Legionellales bacterium RIFCSPHIGHO2_12_FULL_35_11]|nr:MAG: hypothetical protein A3E88_00470 [Legionellales bacterium RIFCSPHIGHO2_12_FULL_35_11]
MDNLPYNELAKLHDIRMPNPLSVWQIAPAWYFLIIVFLILICTISLYFVKNVHFWKAKKQALKLLADYANEYAKTKNSQNTCAKINNLLKRVAFIYFPRDITAGLTGNNWIDFLNKTLIPPEKPGKSAKFFHFIHDSIKTSFTKTNRDALKSKHSFYLLKKELLQYPYQKAVGETDLKLLFTLTKTWIKNQKTRKLSDSTSKNSKLWRENV